MKLMLAFRMFTLSIAASSVVASDGTVHAHDSEIGRKIYRALHSKIYEHDLHPDQHGTESTPRGLNGQDSRNLQDEEDCGLHDLELGFFCPPPFIFGFCERTAFNAWTTSLCLPTNTYAGYQFQKPLPIPEIMPKSDLSTDEIDVYEIEIVQTTANIIGDFDSTVYTFKAKGDEAAFPAKTLVFDAGKEFRIKFINKLVNEDGTHIEHFTKIDQSLHWADPACDIEEGKCIKTPYEGPIPVSIHMHGFNSTEEHEGHPDAWYLPDAKGIDGKYNRHGRMFTRFRQTSSASELWDIDAAVAVDKPMRASTRWYHDHTVGITRNNVFMGLAGFALTVGGQFDSDQLPSGEFDLPLQITDRSFDKNGEMLFREFNRDLSGRNWTADGGGGENFLLPECGEETCNGLGPSDLPAYWVQQYYGIANMVNGVAWPVHEVKAGCYRLRLLNGALTRIYELKFDKEIKMTIIGSDSGLLNKDSISEVESIYLAPGERVEVLVDFSGFAGEEVILRNEFYCYDLHKGTIDLIMKFKVSDVETADSCFSVNDLQTGDIIPLQPDELPDSPLLQDPEVTHNVTLYNRRSDSVMMFSRDRPPNPRLPAVAEMCGIDMNVTGGIRFYDDGMKDGNNDGIYDQPYPQMHFVIGDKPLNTTAGEINAEPSKYSDPTNIYATKGAVQEWIIENTSTSPHPIHIHALDQFSVVKRQCKVNGDWVDVGPLPHEGPGWVKDTVLVYGKTRTVVRTYHETAGTFVYHCHILTHEDRDMMRPFCIKNDDGSIPDSCTILDSNVHCEKPSEFPTMTPTSVPSSLPSAAPTLLHSLMPTSVPTSVPSSMPTGSCGGAEPQGCVDSEEKWIIDGVERSWCRWAGKKGKDTAARCAKRNLFKCCPLTCGACTGCNPPSGGGDSKEKWHIDGKARTWCRWARKKGKDTAARCAKHDLSTCCPATCG